MAGDQPGPKKKDPLREQDIGGFKLLEAVTPLLERLRPCGADPKRKLFYDQYVSSLLLYFFNPTLTSLRGIQQATGFKKVQRKLKIRTTSLGSFSEAQSVFDAELLIPFIEEISDQVRPLRRGDPRLDALDRALTAVDGSLLEALPRMLWALWLDAEHRAAKMHVHFEVLKGAPVKLELTEGSASERASLRRMLEPGRFYILDRGYLEYALFEEICRIGSSFVARVKAGSVVQTIEAHPLSEEAIKAGVVRDRVVRLGGNATREDLPRPVRLVEVRTLSQGKETVLWLVSDRLDLSADLIALIFKCRWAVELFFRWFKCVLGCRHLLAESQNGLTIQVYVAIIASLLISVWTGLKPTKRTYEMICFYFQGWVSEEELTAHIQKRSDKELAAQKV